ncbi:MAG: hypothetical protein ACJ8FY_05835 [Gemmataceae bacterium]
MIAEFLVQKAGSAGGNWSTVCRGPETKAREVFQRQLKFYSVGRFRLINDQGLVIEDCKATPLFSQN